ncbi:unnamed protein product [Lymnaea stagnalis]|uniref:Uncharacterized protein n=1 Tax=Lymnaea stagnalis TaxID=6523 RepID=A0AAV2IMQ4_LYMST
MTSVYTTPVRPYASITVRPSKVVTSLDENQDLSGDDWMDRRKGTPGRNRNVFKGSVLVSLLVESHHKRFPDRAVACKLGRRLFREGHIRSIFGAKEFEDSAQLYVWNEEKASNNDNNMTSPTFPGSQPASITSFENSHIKADYELIQDIKEKVLNRSEAYNIVTSYNTFFQELEQDFGFSHSPRKSQELGWSGRTNSVPYTSTLELKRDTVYSTDSSVDTQTYSGMKGGNKDIQNQLKHSSLTAYSETSLPKDRTSQPPSQHNAPHVTTSPQTAHTSSQVKALPHTHVSPHLTHVSPSVNVDQKQLKTPVISGHPYQQSTQMNASPNPPGSSGSYSDSTMVPEEMLIKDQRGAQNLDYEFGLNQQGTTSSLMSSAAAESVDNRQAVKPDSVLDKNCHRWTHQQSTPLSVSKWTNPNLASALGDPQFISDRKKIRDTENSVEMRSRWLENGIEGTDNGRRWPESTYSYSDNEKQLLEEMRRMKKEHQNTLRTYEGRINKLMAKMHELRNIAEMLENSSSKSSPYGVFPGKLALLNILGDKDLDMKKLTPVSETEQVPPPLPPRPGRGTKVYPNKPIMHTSVPMKPLSWSRIILEDTGVDSSNTIWHGMIEPKINTDELERLFSGSSDVSSVNNLYDDLCLRRGKSKSQPVCIYDAERSQRIISELKSLHCSLPDVIQAFTTLNSSNLHTDSFAELLELITSHRELDKIHHHVKRKGGSHLDVPEYLVFELLKVEHFRERLEFLRFKNKLQINLFEIDQQLRELHTACEEITNSVSLKHVLETVLAVGNYMNAGTERGQADGFKVDILNSLKEMQDPSKQNNLLELIMRIYSHIFESELDFGCPTRFRLPEPSNMRHAAQVSFEDIQRALRELNDELFFVKNKLEPLSKQEGNSSAVSLRVTCENFMTAALDLLAEERKLLDNTQTHFWKTAVYFSLEGQQSSPHDFFQIWASFLHDCKYYWKLAHRNLAKAKFNTDLATKNQLSSSMPASSNPKSVMMKHVVTFQQESDLGNSKAQQLQHINSWIESVGKYAASGIQPETVESGQPKDLLARHHDQSNNHVQASSPPYINQPFSDQNNKKTNSDPNTNRRHQRKSKPDERTPHNKPSTDYVDMQHDRSSPKPIKATPPNVIRPKPVVKASPTMSSPSPNSLHLAQSRTLVPFEPDLPVDNNNNRNKFGHIDDFGFEPLYESLPSHEQSHNGVLKSDHPPPYSDGASFRPPLGSSMSPDPDNHHKKNANFFKSFLKRDQKKPSTGEESPHVSYNSPHKSGGSAPINKLRNTFFNKISSSGGTSKKNADDESKNTFPNTDQSKDSPPKPLRSLPMEQESPELNRGNEKFNGPKLDGITRNALNYQNLNYTEQSQPAEPTPPLPYRPENLEDNTHKVEERLDLGRREPAKGIFSSPGEGAIKLNEKTEHNLGNNLGSGGTNSAFSDEITMHVMNNVNAVGVDSGKPAGRSRVRAPIAFGSNMSISDAYKSSEIAQIQKRENSEFHSLQPISKDKTSADRGSNNSITVRPSPSDPKLLKANTVPVYKAKLIPNYENQSKYDPWFEGGVRGQAEAAVPAMHIPQASNSSEVYRQELQKKSEQYVGGGVYPAIGQPSQHAGVNSKDEGGAFSPPTYAAQTTSSSYHASPLVVSRDTYGQNVSPHKDRNHNQQSRVNQDPTGIPSQDHGQTRNKFENKNNTPHPSHAQQSQHHRQMTNNANFIKRPDGWHGSDRLNQPTYSDSYSDRRHHSVPAHRSSSAHNMLGSDYDSVKANRMAQSLHANMGDQQEYFPQGRISRRDLPVKKTTPTSHRENVNPRVNPPKSVTSLIDKFEKKPEGSQVGLIDINDKPPSMTSTPVVRRKNQGIQPDNGNLSSAPRPYENHSRSQSSGGGKDRAQSVQHGNSENSSHQNTQSSLNNNQVSSMKSPHQAVAPFYVQPVAGPHDNKRQSSAQQIQGQNNQRTLRSLTGDVHRGKNPPDVAQRTSIDQRQYKQARDQDHNFKPINLDSQQQLQDRYSRDVRGHQQTYSDNRSHYHSSKNQADHNLRSVNDREHSEHSHSSSKPVSLNPSTQPQNWSNYAKNPGASGAAHQPSASHPGVIHRPEPVYPMSSPQQDSGTRQQQHDQNQRQSDQQQNPGSINTTYHPSSSAQSQSQRQQNTVLPNYGQPQQQRAQQYDNYQSPPSSQHKENSSSPPYYNMDPLNANSNFTNGKYVDELQRTPHLSNSAFDRPLKAGTYGRQPGAMAVVKPTVMHL